MRRLSGLSARVRRCWPPLAISSATNKKRRLMRRRENPVWQEEERLGREPLPGETVHFEYRSMNGMCHRYIDPVRRSDFELRREFHFLEPMPNARFHNLLYTFESRTIPGIR